MPGLSSLGQVLVASGNTGKLRELQDLLAPLGVKVLAPAEVGGLEVVEEDGDTLEANASKKALAALDQRGMAVLADDSGLFVHALGGEPGIHSARFAGEAQDAAANRTKLLKVLEGVSDRRASFRCVLALARPGMDVELFRGECFGTITEREHGTLGFGYDSIFVPRGYTQSFAQMDPQEKNKLSHRGLALAQLKTYIEKR